MRSVLSDSLNFIHHERAINAVIARHVFYRRPRLFCSLRKNEPIGLKKKQTPLKPEFVDHNCVGGCDFRVCEKHRKKTLIIEAISAGTDPHFQHLLPMEPGVGSFELSRNTLLYVDQVCISTAQYICICNY